MITKSENGAAPAALIGFAVAVAFCGSAAAAPLTFQVLPLKSTWQSYSPSTATPSAALDSNNVVHLKGAMTQVAGQNDAAVMTLQVKFRPGRAVYIPVDMFNGKAGRLDIYPDGTVFVEAADMFSDAQSFTSLEGVTYSK